MEFLATEGEECAVLFWPGKGGVPGNRRRRLSSPILTYKRWNSWQQKEKSVQSYSDPWKVDFLASAGEDMAVIFWPLKGGILGIRRRRHGSHILVFLVSEEEDCAVMFWPTKGEIPGNRRRRLCSHILTHCNSPTMVNSFISRSKSETLFGNLLNLFYVCGGILDNEEKFSALIGCDRYSSLWLIPVSILETYHT